jgi:hypothetical protein
MKLYKINYENSETIKIQENLEILFSDDQKDKGTDNHLVFEKHSLKCYHSLVNGWNWRTSF